VLKDNWRKCPWHGCEARTPHHLFGCRKHWYTLSISERNRIYAAYHSYQRGEIPLVQLREIQQAVLGSRGVA
jgi:hypothetical protein